MKIIDAYVNIQKKPELHHFYLETEDPEADLQKQLDATGYTLLDKVTWCEIDISFETVQQGTILYSLDSKYQVKTDRVSSVGFTDLILLGKQGEIRCTVYLTCPQLTTFDFKISKLDESPDRIKRVMQDLGYFTSLHELKTHLDHQISQARKCST